MNNTSIFNQTKRRATIQKPQIASLLAIMSARCMCVRPFLVWTTILAGICFAESHVGYAKNVVYKPACDQLKESKDSYLSELKVLNGACQANPQVSPIFDAGPDTMTENQLTPSSSMERGTDTMISADFIGGSIISKEEMSSCAYSRRQEIAGPMSRFRFASDEENRLIDTYSQLLSGAILKDGHLNCLSIVNPAAGSLCKMIEGRSLSLTSLTIIFEDIKKSLTQVLAKHDKAAGLESLNISECSSDVLKVGYSPETMHRLSRLSSGGNLNLSKRIEETEQSDSIIQAAERHRLDRVYLDFMKSRTGLIRQFEGSPPKP